MFKNPSVQRRDWLGNFGWMIPVTLLISLSPIHQHHNADSVMSTLVSVYSWEPFFWGQNRFGMLVPLLTTPIKDLYINLYIQNLITIACGIACFPLLQRFLFPEKRIDWGSAIATAVFIVSANSFFQWGFLSTWSIHSTSLCLGLGGMIASEKKSVPLCLVAGVLLILASWINASIPIMLLPYTVGLFAIRWFFATDGVRKKSELSTLLTRVAILLSSLIASKILERLPLPEHRNTWIHVPEFAQWPGLLTKQWTDARDSVLTDDWMFVTGAAGLIASIIAYKKRDIQGFFVLLCVVLSTIAFAILTAILFDGRWRYSLSNLVIVQATAICLFTSTPVFQSLVHQWKLKRTNKALMIPIVLTAICICKYGLPSTTHLIAGLQKNHGALANQVQTHDLTHLAGDYWRVWPAMFLHNGSRLPNGDEVWALTHRSYATETYWKASNYQAPRIGIQTTAPEAMEYAKMLGIPLEQKKGSDPAKALVVLTPVSESSTE